MMTRHGLCRLAGLFGIAAAILAAGGCVTTPGSRMTADPGVGYWMAASAGNAKQQEVHAARIALAEFSRRTAVMPATLHELRAYRARLLAPIEVKALFPAGSPDLAGVPQEQIEKMAAYATAHKEAGAITGAQYCKEWADELTKISQAMAALEARVDQSLRGAEAKLKDGNVAEAESAWQEARKLDRDGAGVLRVEKMVLIAKSRGALAALGSETGTILKRAGEAARKFGTQDSNDADVTACLALVSEAEKVVARFRDTMKTADGQKLLSDDVETALVEREREMAGLRGRCWAEQVRLLAARKKFWPAHQYADEKTREAMATPEHRRIAAVTPLLESYRQMLLPAVRDLVSQSNSQLDRDAHGIALTLCRMTEEIIQFARDRQLRMPEEIATWEKRSAESRSDAQKKIAATMRRRLLVEDFSPLTRENQRLSARVLNRCAELLGTSSANSTAATRLMSVEKLGDKAKSGDYVIECNVPELLIVNAPPVELERAVVKVGRDIREVPNPQYNAETKGSLKTMFSQEVYCYQTIRRQYSKKAKLQAHVVCTHDNQKKVLLSLETEFGEGKTKLDDVQMSGLDEQLDPPFAGTPRTSRLREGLAVDPWPKAVAATLSSDAEIGEAIQKYAANLIAEAIVASAGSYPVDVLAAEAIRSAKAGSKSESANHWGQCLEYCSQLGGGKEEDGWVLKKDRMLTRIAELCKTTWKNSDGEIVRKMPELWTEAVRSALEAAAAQGQP